MTKNTLMTRTKEELAEMVLMYERNIETRPAAPTV